MRAIIQNKAQASWHVECRCFCELKANDCPGMVLHEVKYLWYFSCIGEIACVKRYFRDIHYLKKIQRKSVRASVLEINEPLNGEGEHSFSGYLIFKTLSIPLDIDRQYF